MVNDYNDPCQPSKIPWKVLGVFFRVILFGVYKMQKYFKATHTWNSKQLVLNGSLVISTHFPCKDLVPHPIASQPFTSGQPSGSSSVVCIDTWRDIPLSK